jgi:hypothetical protein
MQNPVRLNKSRNCHPGAGQGVILAEVSAPAPGPDSLDASLRTLRRSALLALAVCALGIGLLALRSSVPQDTSVDRRITLTALVLAAASILTRRSIRAPASAGVFFGTQVASVLCAVGLGLLGGLVAVRTGQWQVGLLYNLAAALLLVRPPARLSLPPRRAPRD